MKHPPYHLRANKAVDRFLLVELLRSVGENFGPISDFTYYGFGGPFLEDLKLLDEYLPEVRLVSIEASTHTRQRQELHRFSSRLRLIPGTMDDFLTHDYAPGKRDIFWLDYTDLKYSRIQEFQRVIGLVPLDSIVRITLRAEIDYAPSRYEPFLNSEEFRRLLEGIQQEFERVFGKVLGNKAEEMIHDRDKFPSIVLSMLREAAEDITRDAGDREFLPFHTICYEDQTQMLTLTGMVVGRNMSQSVAERFTSAKFATFDWSTIQHIELPVLSLREVMKLAPLLPDKQRSGDELWNALGYNIADKRKRSEVALENYGLFHRYHPQFARTIL
ncbi:MAG: hypothetical protein JNN17_03380 [Verrucomicrobiaceae bacterium]|nr:hypothetical protein [Verrucomicrobiaceae bacterium]